MEREASQGVHRGEDKTGRAAQAELGSLFTRKGKGCWLVMSCITSTSMIGVCIHLHNETNTKCKMAVSRSHNNDLLQPLIK